MSRLKEVTEEGVGVDASYVSSAGVLVHPDGRCHRTVLELSACIAHGDLFQILKGCNCRPLVTAQRPMLVLARLEMCASWLQAKRAPCHGALATPWQCATCMRRQARCCLGGMSP